ncbi:MAG: uracil phosphoribosyltransferase [Elusimicrobia bacterium]|nr:uracil phosphoribosyltransferase [Elusimicrobiota bacterium]
MTGYAVCEHPLAQIKLARLRDKNTSPADFRSALEEISIILGLQALNALRTRPCTVQTPLKSAPGRETDQPIVLAAVLRAGLGMVTGISRAVPEARIGHIGLYRNEETLNPVRYYVRLPKDLDKSLVLLCDPMLATGGSAVESIRILKTDGAAQIVLVSLLAAKQGIRRVRREHSDVPIVVAGVDAVLNKKGYIVPGLGDAGDRIFGTF